MKIYNTAMNKINPIVSYFKDTFNPVFQIPNAPEGKGKIHYPTKNAPLFNILMAIKSGFYEGHIEKVRAGNVNKTSLGCFTPSGTFVYRKDSEIHDYTGLVCLDYDDAGSVYNLKKAATKIPYTYAAFISPSMKGVKVLVFTNASVKDYKEAFNEVKDYYDKKLNHISDLRAGNLSRLCYISCDRDLFINTSPNMFIIKCGAQPNKQDSLRKKTNQSLPENTDIETYLVKFTAQVSGDYVKGNRNNFIYALACNCNRYGIYMEQAANICQSIYDKDSDGFAWVDMKRSVNSAYKNTQEFNTQKLPKGVA